MSNTRTFLSLAVVAALGASAWAVIAADASPAASRARALLDAHHAELAANDGDTFTVRNVVVDRDGTEHVRFTRSYLGLPVVGGDFVTHSRNGLLRGATLSLATTLRPDIAARIGPNDAIVAAGADFGPGFQGMPMTRKVVFARDAVPALAWEVTMRGFKADRTPTEMHYFVDARTGRLLDRWDAIQTAAATGTGNSLTLGSVSIATDSVTGGFEMRDTTRGNGTTLDNHNGSTSSTTGTIFSDADNLWGNGATSDRATAAVDAHYGVAATWDYYKTTFGRNGIKNDGKGAKSLVHVGTNWVNASWDDSCFCMRYGDGDGSTYRPLVALDVAGHEMTHGVTSAVNGLAYSRDAGGLNEASSDIMGTMVEFSVANPNDPGDYLIGEEIYNSNPDNTKALRRMFKQDMDGASYVCYPRNRRFNFFDDPHYTSGVANRFFYLLAEGAVVPAGFGAGTSYNLTPANLVCNGDTGIVGIGRTKAAAIWYRAMDIYFTSSSTYAQARTSTLNAAKDLYGLNSPEYNAVNRAWAGANVTSSTR
ncbi:M4 family peptidase [Lysobacter sp. TY2-98]|uniref:M4 family metallopeptidase n=1 Tax=Lysobacter sp. TY2-98 TaxID=2290922 RepID=UPI000E2045D2|nr:M4 family metallopeptidase [Lysobacter sp. TY2-98]AXK72435.1 M4 family peptidase [Lysobacter sp. TY2-98]